MENRRFDTMKITMGAMLIAIFAIFLLLNRQTAGLFEEAFIYLFPIPMVAYSSKYDLKSSLMVFFGMACFSFFFGTFTSIFYAISSALLGLIFGTCLRRKVDLSVTMVLVMGLSAVFNILSTITLASLFGYNINEEISEMQSMMNSVLSSTGAAGAVYDSITSPDFLKRMMIVSMAILGIVQGFIIYQLSLILLRRLRIPVPTAKSIYEIYPPRFTGLIAILGYIFGAGAITGQSFGQIPAEVLQVFWIIGYMYLFFFGYLAIMLFLRTRVTRSALLAIILSILSLMLLPIVVMFAGFAYVTLGMHERLMGVPMRQRF